VTARILDRRKDSGATPDGNTVIFVSLWLISAAGFAGFVLRNGSDVRWRFDASRELPVGLHQLAALQDTLAEPLTLAVAIGALTLSMILRGAKAESLVVLATFALFGAMAVIRRVIFDPPPGFTHFPGWDGLFAGRYNFPDAHIVGLFVIGGIVFIFAERFLSETLDAWLLRLSTLLLFASAGPLRLYMGTHVVDEVIAAYLLAGLFLLPVAFYYERDRRDHDAIELRLERFASMATLPRRVSSRHEWLLAED
jgi:hypothetical protein